MDSRVHRCDLNLEMDDGEAEGRIEEYTDNVVGQHARKEIEGSRKAGEKEEERDEDIYARKVLQCSIENKEACLMCQG